MIDAIWLLALPAVMVAALVIGDVVARWLGFEDWPVEW